MIMGKQGDLPQTNYYIINSLQIDTYAESISSVTETTNKTTGEMKLYSVKL